MLVECVLDVGVQLGEDENALSRFLGLEVEGVFDVEIGERALQDEGWRLPPNPLSPFRRLAKHRVNLSPRSVISDGDSGAIPERVGSVHSGVIRRRRAQHHRIRYRHQLLPWSADPGCHQPDFGHCPLILADPYVVPKPERPGINQNEPTHDLVDAAA